MATLPPLEPGCAGLFVTATDTGVGKTLLTCALAAALGRRRWRVSAVKPFASGCRRVAGPDGEHLVSPDAEALAAFVQHRPPLEVLAPIRYAAPLAPAAAEEEDAAAANETTPAFAPLTAAVARLSAGADCLLVEGIGGVRVPLSARDPGCTVVELIQAFGYPVLLVARSTLGTLNHTALSVEVLRAAGCRIAGVLLNAPAPAGADPSAASNRRWIERMTGVPVLARFPFYPGARPEAGALPEALVAALGAIAWEQWLGAPGT